MIRISKDESCLLRKRAPQARQSILNKHAPSRKREYLVEPSARVITILGRYREAQITEHYGWTERLPGYNARHKCGRRRRHG